MTFSLFLTWESVERSFVQVGQASIAGKALTLQIGDTAKDYNQLKVNIRDCHAAAIGIGSIDISTQTGAQAAVDSFLPNKSYSVRSMPPFFSVR